jgi:hypothetical protein
LKDTVLPALIRSVGVNWSVTSAISPPIAGEYDRLAFTNPEESCAIDVANTGAFVELVDRKNVSWF